MDLNIQPLQSHKIVLVLTMQTNIEYRLPNTELTRNKDTHTTRHKCNSKQPHNSTSDPFLLNVYFQPSPLESPNLIPTTSFITRSSQLHLPPLIATLGLPFRLFPVHFLSNQVSLMFSLSFCSFDRSPVLGF